MSFVGLGVCSFRESVVVREGLLFVFGVRGSEVDVEVGARRSDFVCMDVTVSCCEDSSFACNCGRDDVVVVVVRWHVLRFVRSQCVDGTVVPDTVKLIRSTYAAARCARSGS